MNSDLYLNHDEVTFDVTSYDAETDKPWYTIKLREGAQKVTIFISHEQLRDLTGMAVNAMLTAFPTENFMSAGPLEATYEATDAGVAALTELRCDYCGEPVTTREWQGREEYTHIDDNGDTRFGCARDDVLDCGEHFATVSGTTDADENANVSFK